VIYSTSSQSHIFSFFQNDDRANTIQALQNEEVKIKASIVSVAAKLNVLLRKLKSSPTAASDGKDGNKDDDKNGKKDDEKDREDVEKERGGINDRCRMVSIQLSFLCCLCL
jgi:hypothetical protein